MRNSLISFIIVCSTLYAGASFSSYNDSKSNSAAKTNLPKASSALKKKPSKASATAKKTPSKASSALKKKPSKASATAKKTPSKASSALKKKPSKASATAKKNPSKVSSALKKNPSKTSATAKKNPSKVNSAFRTNKTNLPKASSDSLRKIDFKVGGFFSAVAGKVLNHSPHYPLSTNARYKCPCYIADWSNAGIYTNSFSLNPESRLGVQIDARFNPDLGITTQLVSRGTSMGPNLARLYATYQMNDKWSLQVGRKHIPLYFYSEFQDVGFAYPWVAPPPELYGWQATNYNGATLRYSNSFGDNNITASILTGQEKIKHSLYDTHVYNSNASRDVWNNLLGGDFTFNHDLLTTRLVYLQWNASTHDLIANAYQLSHQRAYGIANNLDFGKSFILTEISELDANYYNLGYTVKAPAWSFGYGYRIGSWTPFINYARYWESTNHPELYKVERFERVSATLRYDLTSNSDIKIQIDRNKDHTINYTGFNTIFRISYDIAF